MTELKMNLEIAQKTFFSTCVADIYRAVDGGCLLGAFTLTLCGIAALSELAWIADGRTEDDHSKMYRCWVKQWIVKKSNKKCNPFALYGIRCALVHTHGSSKALKEANIDGYFLEHDNKQEHWQKKTLGDTTKFGYTVNLESLIAEMTFGAASFFKEVTPVAGHEQAFQKALKDLISLVSTQGTTVTQRVLDTRPYAEIHSALAIWDAPNNEATIDSIESAIHEIFRGIGKCRCAKSVGQNISILPNVTGAAAIEKEAPPEYLSPTVSNTKPIIDKPKTGRPGYKLPKDE